MSPANDPRFWVLREALANYAGDPDDPDVESARPGEILQAAVSLILRGSEALDLLLIKRARAEGDPWSGHMALPGGRREKRDGSLLATAVRETEEEVSISLSSSGSIHLGRLEEVSPLSSRLPSLTIHPFVFGVSASTRGRADSREVDTLHWVPVDSLRAPETRGVVEIRLRGELLEFPCFRVAGEEVWGLTYRILSQFLEISPALLTRP